MSRAKLLLPFTCNFHYSYYLLRILVNCTAQMMDSERAGVLLAAVLIDLRLMHNDFVWLYSTLFRRHRHVMEFVCLYAAVTFYSPFLDEGKEQRLVAASCVFPRNAMLSSPPSFLISVLRPIHTAPTNSNKLVCWISVLPLLALVGVCFHPTEHA